MKALAEALCIAGIIWGIAWCCVQTNASDNRHKEWMIEHGAKS